MSGFHISTDGIPTGLCQCGRRVKPINADYCFLCSKERNPEIARLFEELDSRIAETHGR